ncbi:MAG: ABC transporter permease subunit [Clostridia bacterium]|nr:ABC transporter permease subunit [Clostridia bacterium]
MMATGATTRLFKRPGSLLRAFGRGLREGLTPMLGKEMRSRTRGWRFPALLSAYLLILTAGVSLSLWLTLGQATVISPQIGLSLYGIFVFTLVLLLALIAPVTAAGAVSGERERRTYDLLLVTKASPLGIVLGKWLASVAYLVFLVLAGLPVLAVVFLFGGVPPATLALALLLAVGTGTGYGALGLFLSAALRRTQAATVISLVVVFFLLFGTLVMAAIAASAGGTSPYGPHGPGGQPPAGAPWYVYASPLVALVFVLPGGEMNFVGHGIPIFGAVLRDILQGLFRGGIEYVYRMGYPGYAGGAALRPEGLAAWAPWARFLLYQGVLLVACLFLAALCIAPVKPWTAWLARRRLRRRQPHEAAAG